MLTVILGIGFESAELYASGIKEPEIEPGKPTIGIVHITFETTFFYETVHYKSFDLSYRRQWERLAERYDFNLIQLEGGVAFDTTRLAVQRLIDLGVDAILLFQHEPSVVVVPVELEQKAGILIAVHGIRPLEGVAVPYIGFAEYETCYELGKQFAQYFRENNPGKQAKVIILDSRTVISDIERERGFTDGFKSVLPDAAFFNELEDTGSPQSVRGVLQAHLLRNEGINLIFATSDLRAHAARATLGILMGE
ncbi:MAG TPA: sugar ABC transporter substrate-binding protein [bacterium]|nr:sugar ABC transporter substrate-binding protein [bacterium]